MSGGMPPCVPAGIGIARRSRISLRSLFGTGDGEWCGFVDPGKTDFGPMLRRTLELIERAG